MTSTGRPQPAAHTLQLDIFEPHGFLQRFRFMDGPRALLATGLMSLVAFLLAAAADGNLSQAELGQVLCQDARSYLSAGENICEQYRLSQTMSALRDVGSLVVILLLPMTIPLMFRQWQGITMFLRAMDERGILSIDDRPQVDHEVDLCNAHFRRWGLWSPLVCLIAALLMLLVARAQASGRVYPILQTSRNGYGIEAGDWWVSITGSSLVGVLYFAVGFVVIYIILLQNIHGSRVVLLLWRLRQVVVYEADPKNRDGSFGWSEVQAVLFATWSLTILHGICLGCVGLSLPTGRAVAIAPLLLLWVIVTPFYMIVPVLLTRRNIGAWKRRERAVFQERIAAAPDEATRSAIQHEMRSLNDVKVNPYAGAARRGLHYLGIAGSVIFLAQIVQYIYK